MSSRKRPRGRSASQDTTRAEDNTDRTRYWQFNDKGDWTSFAAATNELLNRTYDEFKSVGHPDEVEICTDPPRMINFDTFKQMSYTDRNPEGYVRKIRYVVE